jgi:excisionase family DNA binding protein
MLHNLAVKVTRFTDRQPPQRLLSKREAARLLGVSRGRTLDLLIKSGTIRTVVIGTRAKVPMSEIERLMTEGAPAEPMPVVAIRRAAQRRIDHRPPNMTVELAKARALRVSDL